MSATLRKHAGRMFAGGTEAPETARPLRHVAIIMDGNGRWAKARGVSRLEGHQQGVEAARRAVETARELGLTHVTLYSFSTENWNRPDWEVRHLMGLLRRFFEDDLAKLADEGVRVRIIGDRQTLPRDLVALVEDAERRTADNTGHTLQIAFNYGGRDELVRAASKLAAQAASGEIDPAAIDEAALTDALDTKGAPDPDLIIRTSGEQRISNFLLWQAAYAEFVFLDCFWPDFGRDEFIAAVEQYQRRERRYGGRLEEDA
ncbi:isoprenyl transferase [Parvularcula dongshanensis]|uniref:Isoprenyl transferase n=1 Tax=Parvularcula dongshanensis TaxID=1173995 RepID=A0A840I3L2_9PROT|nr:isoprenyl transferase [Parvularcula dongshanensis]MBB4658630.1 undecaprenyl diphosphate synthase [Parvularcula dongshanensis]